MDHHQHINWGPSLATLVAGIALALGAGAAAAHEGHDHANGSASKAQKPWGMPGDPRSPSRTIEIVMSDDKRFTPSAVEVRQGETVRFVVSNKGKLQHDMAIGDTPMVHVRPGRTESLVWLFSQIGEFDFACLVPGHHPAGMAGKIKVLSR